MSTRWRVGYLDGKMTAYKELLPCLSGDEKTRIEREMGKLEKELEKEVRETQDEAVRNYAFTRCD